MKAGDTRVAGLVRGKIVFVRDQADLPEQQRRDQQKGGYATCHDDWITFTGKPNNRETRAATQEPRIFACYVLILSRLASAVKVIVKSAKLTGLAMCA